MAIPSFRRESAVKRVRGRFPVRSLLLAYGVVALGLGLLLGWLAIRDIAWGDLGGALASYKLPLILVAWAMTLVAGYVRGLRWRLVLPDRKVSALRLFLIEQTGSALDTLSPVRVLDEVVETGILTVRDRLHLGTVLATLALQRTFEFATTILLLGVGSLFLEPFRQFWPYLVAGTAAGGIAILLLFTVGPALSRVPRLARINIVPQFASSVTLVKRNPKLAVIALSLSIAQAVIIGLAGWVVGVATNTSVGIVEMAVITLGVMFFSSAVPGLPMALGTFEFAAISLLRLWGVETAQAGAFAVMLHAMLFIPPVLVALVFLPREGLLSISGLRQLAAGARAQEPGTPERELVAAGADRDS